jgi:26S proteasome non-ATPase regulatory subunit 10
LHLAMESAYAEAAVLLINAGADRSRVSSERKKGEGKTDDAQENLDQETAEQMEGVGGQEQKRARAYVLERCGPA